MDQARAGAKHTEAGPALDAHRAWGDHKHALSWLEDREEPAPGAEAGEAIRRAWLEKLQQPLHRLCDGDASAHVVRHERCLECWVALSPPEAAAEVLRRWSTAVNTRTHLVAVNESCTKASIFIPLLQPTADDVELVDAALRYVAVELRPILEVLRRHPGLAANWGQWLRTSPTREGGNHRE
jgi:hypothetical protein